MVKEKTESRPVFRLMPVSESIRDFGKYYLTLVLDESGGGAGAAAAS